MQRWRNQYIMNTTIESKLKFFKLRWIILKKKILLRGFKRATTQQHRLEKNYSIVLRYKRAQIYRNVMSQWVIRLREEFLDKRRLKFICFKQLKINLQKGRVSKSKADLRALNIGK